MLTLLLVDVLVCRECQSSTIVVKLRHGNCWDVASSGVWQLQQAVTAAPSSQESIVADDFAAHIEVSYCQNGGLTIGECFMNMMFFVGIFFWWQGWRDMTRKLQILLISCFIQTTTVVYSYSFAV